jgi:hypothetical protein
MLCFHANIIDEINVSRLDRAPHAINCSAVPDTRSDSSIAPLLWSLPAPPSGIDLHLKNKI